MRLRYNGHDYLQNERILRGWDHQSDVAGRITRGNCGPLSWSEVKNGRPTASVFRMICSGGTASSKSNDRTNPNRMAFALIIFPRVCPSVDMNMPKKMYPTATRKAHTITAKRYPMHACAPAMNVIRFPNTLGMALTASGIASQRSGLRTDRRS